MTNNQIRVYAGGRGDLGHRSSMKKGPQRITRARVIEDRPPLHSHRKAKGISIAQGKAVFL